MHPVALHRPSVRSRASLHLRVSLCLPLSHNLPSIHPSRLASRTLSIIVRTLGVAVFVADPAVASRA